MSAIIYLDGTTVITDDKDDPVIQQELLQGQEYAFDAMNQEDAMVLKAYRSTELFDSDWTQGADSPLDSTTKTAWATYRQGLRDLPASANWPNRFTKAEFPLAPGVTDIPDHAVRFVPEVNDPLGIGTTSWVGSTSETVELSGPPVYKNTPNTRKTIIFEAPLDTISGGTVSIGDTFAYDGNSCTITGVAATSITLATGIGATISIGTTGTFLHQETRYFAQDKPALKASVSVGSTVVGIGSTVVVTLSTVNQGKRLNIAYYIDGYQYDGLILDNKEQGSLTLIPDSNFVGVATLTVGLSTDSSKYYPDDGLAIIFDVFDHDGGIGTFVGITTT